MCCGAVETDADRRGHEVNRHRNADGIRSLSGMLDNTRLAWQDDVDNGAIVTG